MSCYRPWIGIDRGILNENGKRDLTIVPGRDLLEVRKVWPDSVLIPCGKCIGCRLDYSRRWADRMMLELETSKKAIFLTLTYGNEHLVNANGEHFKYMEKERYNLGSLYLRHLQLFLKSIRKEYAKQDIKLRFYACGEYGSWENTHRPHYHVILFGLGLSDFPNKVEVGFNELRQPVYTDDNIARFWNHGYISFGDVSWRSCAYVARYVTKKALDASSDLMNESLSLNPIFCTMSRKPGLGYYYLQEHPDCLDWSNIPISTPDGKKKISLPKYFINQLKVERHEVDESTGECTEVYFSPLYNPEKYDSIVQERVRLADDKLMSELNNTDLGFIDYLAVKESETLKKIASLKRYV